MRLLSNCFHQKVQNGNSLISSIIKTKCPEGDLKMGVSSAVINITKCFQKC